VWIYRASPFDPPPPPGSKPWALSLAPVFAHSSLEPLSRPFAMSVSVSVSVSVSASALGSALCVCVCVCVYYILTFPIVIRKRQCPSTVAICRHQLVPEYCMH
jgi:hypothetical protein